MRSWVRQRVLNCSTRSTVPKKECDKLDSNEIENFCYSKETIEKIKRQMRNLGKYIQVVHLVKNLCPDYVKIFFCTTQKYEDE